MPITLRPGTTATRTEIALIERAMSSASPMIARGLDPGRRFQLVQRHDRPRANLHDLTAHAEILEHRFEQAGVLSSASSSTASAFTA